MNLPPLGLYIHLPWCERKCPYCDFNSHETRVIPETDYVAALLRDLDGEVARAQGREVSTLFIGGGTPSLFSPDAITELMRGIAARVPLAADFEATMEANPGSAEAAKFSGFRDAGINRLSLGVQSFNDAQLRALGRIHDAEQAGRAIELAKAAGFERFNIDLMHGLPDQNEAAARADLDAALQFEPTHLSWYQLTLEPNTVFYKRPPLLPVEDTLAGIQEAGEALLQAAGFDQYEVSAWSRPGEACRHNLNYWEFGDYLAIGAGAHGKTSYRDGRIERYAKRRQPSDYLASASGEFEVNQRWLAEEDIPGDYAMNALRLKAGVPICAFSARTGLPLGAISEQLAKLQELGLLEDDPQRLRCSATGWRFLDTVVTEFI